MNDLPIYCVLLLVLAGCTGGAVRPEVAQPVPAGLPSAEAVQLTTPAGVVHGTLLVPGGPGKHPVALLISGSGPTDRDGNSIVLPGANNSLKLLAEGLARDGVATLRYDKRGVGESRGAATVEDLVRFDTFVDDAAAWLRQLRADPRFSTVSAVGHSEGSLIGMLAATEAGADAVVSLSGVGHPAPYILRQQLAVQLPPELWRASERVLAELEAGRTADSVPAALQVLYRPSVQPYLISWFRVDPARAIADLQVPVLIAQGTTDIQVPVAEAEALHAARPAAELLIVEGMNHVLKLASSNSAQQMASYSDPALAVAPALIERISAFLSRAARHRT